MTDSSTEHHYESTATRSTIAGRKHANGLSGKPNKWMPSTRTLTLHTTGYFAGTSLMKMLMSATGLATTYESPYYCACFRFLLRQASSRLAWLGKGSGRGQVAWYSTIPHTGLNSARKKSAGDPRTQQLAQPYHFFHPTNAESWRTSAMLSYIRSQRQTTLAPRKCACVSV